MAINVLIVVLLLVVLPFALRWLRIPGDLED